jgi:hypothetical protein
MRYCVFSGSSWGVRAEYGRAANELGELLVEAGIGLVYGGASIGLWRPSIQNSETRANSSWKRAFWSRNALLPVEYSMSLVPMRPGFRVSSTFKPFDQLKRVHRFWK